MGVGKSTVGKQLADFMKYDFIDLDSSIEALEDQSIQEIFVSHGEQYFRRLESLTLKKVIRASNKPTVISLGGGTLSSPENNNLVLTSGICVYLYKPWEETKKDLEHLKDRPLVIQKSMAELEELFYKRIEKYNCSQLKMPMNSTFTPKKLSNYLKLLTNR